MIRTQVSFDKKTYEAAKEEARKRGISFAELCRRAIARILADGVAKEGGPESSRPWMRLAGLLESRDPEASRSVDAVVYGTQR
jgi:hypothetical protein